MKGVSLNLQNVAANAAANTGGYWQLVNSVLGRRPASTKQEDGTEKVKLRVEKDADTGEMRIVRISNAA